MERKVTNLSVSSFMAFARRWTSVLSIFVTFLFFVIAVRIPATAIRIWFPKVFSMVSSISSEVSGS